MIRENAICSEEIQRQSAQIAALTPLRRDVETLSAEVKELNQSLDDLRSLYDTTRERLVKSNAKAADAEALRRRIAECEATIESLDTESAQQRAAADRQSATIAELDSVVAKLKSQLASSQESLLEASSREAELQQLLEDAKRRTEILETSRDALERENALMRDRSQDYDVARASWRVTEKTLSDHLAAARQENLTLVKDTERLTGQIAALTPLRRDVERLSGEVKELNQSLDDLRSRYETTRERLVKANAKAADAEALRRRIAESEATIESLDSESAQQRAAANRQSATIADLNSTVTKLKSENAASQASLSESLAREAELQQSLEGAKRRAETLEETRDVLEREITLLRKTYQDYEVARTSWRATEKTLSDSLSATRQENLTLTSEKEHMKEQIAALEDRINESASSNRSLSTEIEAQAADATAEKERLRSKVWRLSAKLSEAKATVVSASAEIENLRKSSERAERESSRRIAELEREIERKSLELANGDAQLRAESERVTRVQSEIARMADENRALQERVGESTALIVDDLNAQIRFLRAANEKLTTRNSELEEEMRESRALLDARDHELRDLRERAESAESQAVLAESLRGENAELAMTLSELEDGQREKNQGVGDELNSVKRENRALKRTIRTLSQQIEADELDFRQRLDALERLPLVLTQKEELIAELKALTDSQNSTIAKLRDTNQRLLESHDFEVTIERIERALGDFNIDTLDGDGMGTLSQRLQAILTLIQRIRTAFNDSLHTIDRMTRVTSSQHSFIMKFSRDTLEKHSFLESGG
jgi:chromosome segregation ATPase